MYQENDKVFQILSLHYYLLVLLGQGVIWSVVSFLIYVYFKKRKCSITTHAEMPGQKLPLFSITGIFIALSLRSTRNKLSLPLTAFLPLMLSGEAALFPRERAITAKIGIQPFIILKKADSVEEFLSSDILSAKPFAQLFFPFFGQGLFLSYGDKWKSRRKLANSMFQYQQLEGYFPIFDKEAKVLIEILKRKHQEPWINVMNLLSHCSMDIICKTFMGLNIEGQKKVESKFVNAMARVTKTVMQRILNPLYHYDIIFGMTTMGQQFKEDINFLREFSLQVLKERKEEKKLRKEERAKDTPVHSVFLDGILQYQQNHPDMSDEDIRDELMSFIFAGEDTTTSLLSWALYLIGLHPEIQSKIQDEIDGIFGCDPDRKLSEEDLKQMNYLDYVLKECHRLYPSVPVMARTMLEDSALCGYKIKKGSIVVVDLYNLHRDPDVFPNPEVFDPDRFRPENCAGRSFYAYIPFSGGVRSCVGRKFALMETKTIVAHVLNAFSLISLEPRDKIHISFELVLRTTGPLKVKFLPRDITKEK